MSIKRRFEKWFYLDEEEESRARETCSRTTACPGATAKKSGSTETANC